MRRLLPLGFLSTQSYVYSHQSTSETLLESTLPGMFRISFVDRETLETKGECTGFFIDEDGFGITSGAVLKSRKDCKMTITTWDGNQYDAEPKFFDKVPGIGIIVVNAKVKNIQTTKVEVKSGATVYAVGYYSKYPFFNDLFVTDTEQESFWKSDRGEENINLIRTTGPIPSVCVGGPLLNEEGKVVAVVVKLDLGFGLSIPIVNLKHLSEDEERWGPAKLWINARESIIRWLENKTSD